MIQIRRNVFETNSSSTHSVTWRFDGLTDPKLLELDEEGFLRVFMEGYCSACYYDDLRYKLGYLMQLCGYTNDIYLNAYGEELKENLELLYDCDDFKDLEAVIIDYIGYHCKGIRFNEDSSYGYIDDGHDYDSINEFLDENCTDIINFVFGGAVLHYNYNG